MSDPVLDVQHLSITYTVGAGSFPAVSDVSLQLYPGRVVGIVGETGCGKSTLAKAIPRLLPEPPATIGGGTDRLPRDRPRAGVETADARWSGAPASG